LTVKKIMLALATIATIAVVTGTPLVAAAASTCCCPLCCK
jgi:hypothetical protein